MHMSQVPTSPKSDFEDVSSILMRSSGAPTAPASSTGNTAPAKEADSRVAVEEKVVSESQTHTNGSVAHKQAPVSKGLQFGRMFTVPGIHPYDQITWEKRSARITGHDGSIVFEQNDVEVPVSWSQQATNIVVQKYFRGLMDTPERETSVKQMVTRVAKTIADWGREDGYFASEENAEAFEMELTAILVNQYAAFNSPVWFNVGHIDHPQCSACFIINVEDDMDSILEWYRQEGKIFQGGSGSGVSVSKIRADGEPLSKGGKSSGVLSFMRGADSIAGAIKSGGTTRRAAKMVVLDIEHPEVEDFIWAKAKEEKKAWALGEAGYDMSLNSDVWQSIQFQNANNSVRVTDAFMQAVENNENWDTKYIGGLWKGKTAKTYKARELMRQLSQAAWECADPGIQYDTTINQWHTCSNTDRIYASNPCSEYMFLNDTACNLASLNLMKFKRDDASFNVELFEHVADVMITAQEIVVDRSLYPTQAMTQNSHDFRTLGIGFANLGALLMSEGLAYDSQEGRDLAAAIMALLSGRSYKQSAKIAAFKGPFARFAENREPTLNVMRMHRKAVDDIDPEYVFGDLLNAARESWDQVIELGSKDGLRNAQISVLAPTGTIGFLMDCDTTGVEPAIALVSYKWLVGGGMIKIVNQIVPEALEKLGYSEEQRQAILAYIEEHDTIEGAPELKDSHLPVFDCAFKSRNGKRSIAPMGHLRMMSAVQPFISGAISKTVNLPEDATVEDVEEIYMEGWRMGLKALAIYRDGCKKIQPLTTKKEGENKKKEDSASKMIDRTELPAERQSITHEFKIAGHKGYITVGLFADGRPGEVFISMNKAGSTIAGLMDSFAISVSFNLQYGVPLKSLVRKFAHTRFEPAGITGNENIRIAKSIVDYIFRWMALRFLPTNELAEIGLNNLVAQADSETETLQAELPLNGNGKKEEPAPAPQAQPKGTSSDDLTSMIKADQDAPLCDTCGSVMVRNASCYKCLNCGSSSGCS